jgi:hypothetical protein
LPIKRFPWPTTAASTGLCWCFRDSITSFELLYFKSSGKN